MTKHSALASALLVLFVFNASAQKLKKADKAIIERLEQHVTYLADDKLQGRRAGTEGEKLASQYIIQQFQQSGVAPKGKDGYLQPFPIYEGREAGTLTKMVINGETLENGKDFFPFSFSADGEIDAMPSIALLEEGMPWFRNLKETLEANAANPHFDLVNFIRNTADEAAAKGATALIIYNNSGIKDHLSFDEKDVSKAKIPVVYIHRHISDKFFEDEAAGLDIQLQTSIKEKYRQAHNVVSYIDNGAKGTVVIGAHYDHLGFGEDGNSLVRTMEKQIHNGADDNASGTSALIELASLLKDKKFKNSNYLLIAFSGEELGLFGSKFFVENPTISLQDVHYMINMDMIGRLSDTNNTITVGGVGTSPAWSSIANEKNLPFGIKIDSSGSGPSDHTSFYRKDIPVLFFFTGLHSDYHKPSDDAQHVNTTGIYHIMQYITGIISRTSGMGQKPAFAKTRERQTTTTARFSVSLGIMPDYTFSGPGVKADGVTEGRPAHKAGLQAGDIVLQIGESSVNSMEDYMQALSKFKKGDKTKVKYKRGEALAETAVEF